MSPRSFSNLAINPIAFGAFKIGRNVKTKYPAAYDMADLKTVDQLLNTILDLGINLIDTAPAYGESESRIGQVISHRRDEFLLSSKVGETFHDGQSHYDYSAQVVRTSVHESLKRLRTDHLDFVFIHSNGDDQRIMNETDCVATLQSLREQGMIHHIGMSGKTVTGAAAALAWADALMVEYHMNDTSHEEVIARARRQGAAVLVKKGLASGNIPAATAIPFVLKNSSVTSLVIGTLNVDHMRENLRLATP